MSSSWWIYGIGVAAVGVGCRPGYRAHMRLLLSDDTGEDVDSFVAKCYSTKTLQLVYAPIIYPVHGPDMWPRTPHPDIVPPDLTRLPGRPKGARQKTAEELAARSKVKTKAARIAHQVVTVRDGEDGRQKMSRKGLMPEYKCRLCGEKGHNKRRCPQGIQLGKSKGITFFLNYFHSNNQ